MAKLELRYLNGDVETRELSKQEPVSIGRHTSNDVCVADDDVDVMHCRIAWNKKCYEVTAANLDGVELNGTLVRKSPLQPGDVLRVGSMDIALAAEEGNGIGAAKQDPPTDQIKLQPITEDELAVPGGSPVIPPSVQAESEAAQPTRRGGSNSKSKTEQMPDDDLLDDDVLEELDADADDVNDSVLLPDDIFEEDDDEVHVADLPESPAVPMLRRRGSREEEEAPKEREPDDEVPEYRPKKKGPSLVSRMRSKMRERAVRPGEQDIIRSPIVISFGVGIAVLTLVGLVFFFMINRESANRLYDAAVLEMEEGKYNQAIPRFGEFLELYPHHRLVDMALIGRDKCKVEQEIKGGSPKWQRGIEALQDFIDHHRDREAFAEQHGKIREYAEEIALGAAQSAEDDKKESLIKVSQRAGTILERYAPEEGPPAEFLKKVEAARESARAAIKKQGDFDSHVAEIKKALQQKRPMQALVSRQKLLDVYPDLARDAQVVELLDKSLEMEKSLVKQEDVRREALVEDHPHSAARPLSLTLHTRSRTDEVSDGRTVFAVGKDCCYGIDTVTGDPVWRRVIGLDTPFFPMEVQTSVPAVLVFDTNHRELVLLERTTGKLVWRQPIGEDVSGPPLIDEGEIYLPTLSRHLYKLDVDTGRLTMRLVFSQPILSPPAVVSDSENNDWLVVAGERALLYTLKPSPLSCTAVTNLEHKAGAIQAPMIKMGRLVLLAENVGLQKCRLRPLRLDERTKRLRSTGEVEITDPVRDTPMLWGKTLFVPCGRERVEVFTVSDSPDQRPLTAVAGHQLQNAVDSRMFLELGPGGQIWMASSALRKLELKTDNIKLDSAQTAVGFSTQPLQTVGNRMYVGRHEPFSRSVVFSLADRDQMTSHWRTIVGTEVRVMRPNPDGTCICVTEDGNVFRIGSADLDQGGFKHEAAVALQVPDGVNEPLRITPLADGSIAIDCGPPEPRVWIVNRSGQLQRTIEPDEPLEAGPVALRGGIVLPLSGRLQFVGNTGGTPVKDFLSPVGQGNETKWAGLTTLNETDLLAVDTRGKLTRVQLRTQDVAHLADASKTQLGSPVDVPVLVHNDRVVVADADGKLRLLDASNLDTLSESPLDAPATSAPWIVGGRLFLEVGGSKLACFAVEPNLNALWSIPLDGARLAGAPFVFQDRLLAAIQNGELWVLDPERGNIVHRVNVHQPITMPPQVVGTHLVVPSIDGSLHRIDAALQTAALGEGQ